MNLYQHLTAAHDALVELYNRPGFEHLRAELAETIVALQHAIDLEKERRAA